MANNINLKNISLKKAYSSDSDDILHDFYIPALEVSIQYDRIAGFFSSSSLAIAARGILGLIKNGGVMKLIVSPKLSKKDLGIILSSHEEPEKYIEEKMLEELDKLEDKFVRDHVLALGGSNNESATGWLNSIEGFKGSETEYVEIDSANAHLVSTSHTIHFHI